MHSTESHTQLSPEHVQNLLEWIEYGEGICYGAIIDNDSKRALLTAALAQEMLLQYLNSKYGVLRDNHRR